MTETIHLNDYALVRLTAEGKAALDEYYAQFPADVSAHKLAAMSGVAQFTVWELMHIFGPKCINGAEPFVGLRIEIVHNVARPLVSD